MTPDEVLAALIATLRDLMIWLTAEGIPHVIIGGVAASLLGRPRATRDVDVVILAGDTDLESLLNSSREYGFTPGRPDAVRFAATSRVLQIQHESDGIGVDISLGILPFEEEMIARSVRVRIQDIEIPLARAEDLIVMKTLAFRPGDVTDIESLLDVNPRVDMRRVRRWVGRLAEALEEPEIAERLETLLAMRRGRRAPRKTKRRRKR